jgi:hypothetical protein
MTNHAVSRQELIELVAQWNDLLERVEDAPDCPIARRALERFERKYPAIDDYDSAGNYIGTVRNENGWTP